MGKRIRRADEREAGSRADRAKLRKRCPRCKARRPQVTVTTLRVRTALRCTRSTLTSPVCRKEMVFSFYLYQINRRICYRAPNHSCTTHHQLYPPSRRRYPILSHAGVFENRLLLSVGDGGLLVGLTEGANLALLAVLYWWKTDIVSPSSRPIDSNRTGWGTKTNLPLGKTQVHLATAFSSQTRGLLEGSADRASSNGQVAVVAVKVERPVSSAYSKQGVE